MIEFGAGLSRKKFLSLLLGLSSGVILKNSIGVAQTHDGQRTPPITTKSDFLQPPKIVNIRWAAWYPGSEWANHLMPARWHSRHPFYTYAADNKIIIDGNRQEVMDQENAYASYAGIDCWAFTLYHPQSDLNIYNYALERYLSSGQKNKPSFSLILQGSHLGKKQNWQEFCQSISELFQHEKYLKLASSRPLVFIYDLPSLNKTFGGYGESTQALIELRNASRKRGLNNPIIVAQNAEGPHVHFGFDAFGAYTANGEGAKREYPYTALMAANFKFWEAQKGTSRTVIPLLNLGWDPRPRLSHPDVGKDYGGNWYAQPSPEQIIQHLRLGINWLRTNQAYAALNMLLIYAWDEFDEGGWLAPTLAEGTQRIEAFRKALG